MVTEQNEPSQVTLDVAAARYWIAQLHGDSDGLIHVCSTGHWTGRACQTVDEAVEYVQNRDQAQAQGIYVRATTVAQAPEKWRRGSEVDSACLPALWADIDIAGPGHKTPKPLPETEEDARKLIKVAGLPEPTLWVHSGGGLYPWWMLGAPWCISNEEQLNKARELSRGWHEVIAHAASELGWHYGTETADLTRVMRVLGTVNRKVPNDPKLCRLVGGGSGAYYTFGRLFEAMSDRRFLIPAPELVVPVSTRPTEPGQVRPGDDFNERMSWQEILGPENWQVHHTRDHTVYWTRPGKELRDGWSATTGRDAEHDRLYVFSSSTVFPTDRPIDKFGAYAFLHHAGNLSVAAAQLKREGFGKEPPVRVTNLDEIGSVLNKNETALVPATPDHPVPEKYFGEKGGLAVDILADDVGELGPVAVGLDDILWSYSDGFWRPDQYAVRNRAVRLLGPRYRRGHTTNCEDVVRSRAPRITCEPIEQFINFQNGLLDWRTGQLYPHTPDTFSTVQLPVKWNPGAVCPEFDRFLPQVVPLDMLSTVWELIGYLMYSGNPLHKAVMLLGTGRNGKGTYLRTVRELLGRRNVTEVTLQSLTANRFSPIELFGKIANIAGDIDSKYLEETAMFKAITGSDTISAERKYRDPFSFRPWAVPVFSANAVPGSIDSTPGFFSRWVILPFPNSFEGREDRELDPRLQSETELEGVAAKAVLALRDLMTRGRFLETESGRAAVREFESRIDPVRSWVEECCRIDPGSELRWPRPHLYDSYKNWCTDTNHRPLNRRNFLDRLRSLGLNEQKIEGTFYVVGIEVVATLSPMLPYIPSTPRLN